MSFCFNNLVHLSLITLRIKGMTLLVIPKVKQISVYITVPILDFFQINFVRRKIFLPPSLLKFEMVRIKQ